jgi:hypothetical protein
MLIEKTNNAAHRTFLELEGIPSLGYQILPQLHAVRVIEPKNMFRYSANVGEGNYSRTIQTEMLDPTINSWMIQPRQFPCFQVDGSDNRSLQSIAHKTCPSQIVFPGLASVLTRDNVIDFVRVSRVFFVDQAIFTTEASSLLDKAPQSPGNWLAHSY